MLTPTDEPPAETVAPSPVSRRNVALAVIAAFVLVFFGLRSCSDEPAALEASASEQLTSGSIRRQVGQVLNEIAARWLDSPPGQRTFEGAPTPSAWLTTATTDTLRVAVTFTDVCVIGEIDGTRYGTPIYVGVDDSRVACDADFMQLGS